jgi:hypothetical protein
MVWGKAGTTTLGSAGDNIDSGTITASKCNQFLSHEIASGNTTAQFTFNGSTGSEYASRWSNNGGSENVYATQSSFDGYFSSSTAYDIFNIIYNSSIVGEEKLSIMFTVDTGGSGAGNAPQRAELVSKYVPSSLSTTITKIECDNTGSGSFDTGSNLSVLGSDITTAAAIPFEANAQVGSRFEETDTRKMYSFNTQSNVTESTDGSYTVLKFTGDATFTPTSSFNVEYLVVAGGGGSGAGYTTWSGRGGGGGGSGGYLSGTGHGVTPQSYSITVGAGGTANNNGSNSVFSSFTSIGGGRGGQIAGNASAVGGSGGGGSGGDNGSAGTSGQGNTGANGAGNGSGGAGGGGSNSAGSAGSVPTAGAGGSGTANDILTGSNVTYASGGAGGNSDSSGAGTAGGDNTGNGASGGSGDSGSAGASGGSGIVILRFLTSGNGYNINTWQEIGT